MEYKLAKQLKDAGLTQPYYYRANKAWYDEDGDFNDYGYDERDTYIPKLEELIDACGDEFEALIKQSGGWNATNFQANGSRKIKIGPGETPTEAVARLWLELNEKR